MSPDFQRMQARVPRAAEIFEAASERGDKIAQAASVCALLRALFSQRAQTTDEFVMFDKGLSLIVRSLASQEDYDRFRSTLVASSKALYADLSNR